jgi:hypothetical protein
MRILVALTVSLALLGACDDEVESEADLNPTSEQVETDIPAGVAQTAMDRIVALEDCEDLARELDEVRQIGGEEGIFLEGLINERFEELDCEF